LSSITTEPAVFVLEDGRVFRGRAYGALGTALGEAVFSTGMTGYQETITDPSYAGQLVVQTAPHIGNTGVNAADAESRRIWVAGYVVRVHVVPAGTTYEQIAALRPSGVFFSNGPGDPATAGTQIETLREVLRARIPFFGICFGNQLLGRALGFGTYKLVFGHRGINQPVLDRRTRRVEITAHNHGFAVDAPLDGPVTAPEAEFGRVEVSHVCLNDDVVEGLNCLDLPAFSVQYHPEAAAGPHDASYLFGRFVELMDSYRDGPADTTIDNAVPGGAQGAQESRDADTEGQH
jgi:carbamoyl-phosphate synthase small subunit